MEPLPDAANDPAAAMGELRRRALETAPGDFGIAPGPDFPRVYGVLMEWPVGDFVATVAALCDGNASLYTTSDFGVIGGYAHERVRSAAMKLVAAATAHADEALPSPDPGYPEAGTAHFLLLTFDGVRRLPSTLEPAEPAHADLIAAGLALLQELRAVAELRRAKPP
jgi:hypothetical protein